LAGRELANGFGNLFEPDVAAFVGGVLILPLADQRRRLLAGRFSVCRCDLRAIAFASSSSRSSCAIHFE
jgi:hypothetical protein